MLKLRLGAFAMLAFSACASAPGPAPSGPPDLTLTIGLPAPPQAKVYADCIAQASSAGAMNRERDGGTLRFTCTGDVAARFCNGLAAWSAKADSEYQREGRTYRFSKKLIKDSYGVGYCVANAGAHTCIVILAVGPFINEGGDTRD